MSNYYDRIAHLYDATRPFPQPVSEKIADYILELVGATLETKFLEPGIGTGRTGLPIIRRGYPYTGIDISNEMMSELPLKLPRTMTNLTLIQGDASSLPLQNDSFDVVLTTHVLQCLPDWQVGLSEIRRVLKPSGVYLACENLMPKYQKDFEVELKRILAQYQPKSIDQPSSNQNAIIGPWKAGMEKVLSAQGADVETVTAATWQAEQTVGELFSVYESKAVGLCWAIADPVFSKAINEFKEWCHQNYDSFDTILSDSVNFDITVARHWSKLRA